MQHTPCPNSGNPARPTKPFAVTYLDLAHQAYDLAVNTDNDDLRMSLVVDALRYRDIAFAHAFDATHALSERG